MHECLTKLRSVGGQLLVAGSPLDEVLSRVGSTPAYLYDRHLVAQRVDVLRRCLPDQIKLHYAIKANPHKELVAWISSQVDGFDVASQGELDLALYSDVSPASVSFAGPGKSLTELQSAVDAGIIVSVESATELARLQSLASASARPVQALLRLNPDFQLRRSGMVMGGVASAFGIDVELLPALESALKHDYVDVIGFHVYAGSQNLDATALSEGHVQTLALVERVRRFLPGGLRYLNLGGGFGIPYFAGDLSCDVETIGYRLRKLLDESASMLESCEVVLELGRYLVGEAGYYVMTVADVKESRGKRIAIVDGGLHHHLANSGNLGQAIRRNYPVVVGNKMDVVQRETISISGPLCTPLDIVGSDLELPPIEIGDQIVVLQSGAYGLSASPLGFLSREAPAEILL